MNFGESERYYHYQASSTAELERSTKTEQLMKKTVDKIKQDFLALNLVDKDGRINALRGGIFNRPDELIERDVTLSAEMRNKNRDGTGERLEQLSFLILNKYLGADFLILRTSEPDDVLHENENGERQKAGRDLLIIDNRPGRAGQILAVIDLYASKSEKSGFSFLSYEEDKTYLEKINNCMEENNKGGTTIIYGCEINTVDTHEGKRRALTAVTNVKNIPTFTVAFDSKLIRIIEADLEENPEKQSVAEKIFLMSFVAQILSQIENIETNLGTSSQSSLIESNEKWENFSEKLKILREYFQKEGKKLSQESEIKNCRERILSSSYENRIPKITKEETINLLDIVQKFEEKMRNLKNKNG